MSDPLPCGQAVCPSQCHDEPRSLADVLARFEREAVRGVCDTGRYRCRYYAWGQGPPLVFVHGLGDAARAYLPMIARLACGFRCIAYELPDGRGDGANLRQYAHEHLVQDLIALLDHLGHPQTYVFGSSFGATVALAAMHAYPGRIPRGILAGGFACRPLAPAERFLAYLARWWPGTMRRLPFRKLVGRGMYGPLRERAPELWEYFLETTGGPPIAAVARRALLIHQLDLRSRLPEVRQPVLLVCGDSDTLVRRECEDELLRGLPHVQRVELQDCCHMPHYSHSEVLALLVRQFLTPPESAPMCAESSCQASCSST